LSEGVSRRGVFFFGMVVGMIYTTIQRVGGRRKIRKFGEIGLREWVG
jgi:hypothetical protein